jgi:hypothetical protein
MTLQEKMLEWDNLWLAYQDAARGKRGHPAPRGPSAGAGYFYI